MKRFLIVSALLIVGLRMQACMSEAPTHNSYMFSVFHRNMMNDAFADQLNVSWRDYVHGNIDKYDVAGLADVAPSEFYKSDNKIIRIARQRGDTEMCAYLKLLTSYLNLSSSMHDVWSYPSKREILDRRNRLMKINQQARLYRGNRLKQQYALLVMRSFFQLNNFTACENYWNSNVAKMPVTVYKKMMMDLYAGTLLRNGLTNKACNIYAQLNDMQSIKWCMRKCRNVEGIKRMYVANANSPVLPYLVQDFVNNAQETLDDADNGDAEWFKMIDVSPVYRNEVEQFIRFANTVVEEKKTRTPILWQTASAYLNFLFDRKHVASEEIDKAMAMDGTTRMKDNARAIKLLISTGNAQHTAEYSNYLLNEIKWLQSKEQEDGMEDDYYHNHYTDVIDRIVYNNIIPLYNRWGKTSTSMALFSVMHDMHLCESGYDIRSPKQQQTSDYRWNCDYQGEYFDRLDTMKVENLEALVAYLHATPADKFEQWIVNNAYKDADYYNDLIGTKLMRLCQYQKAIGYLEKVSLGFLRHQNISGYMNNRNFTVERWMEHQKLEGIDGPDKVQTVTVNPKVEFCRTMADMENQYHFLSNEEDRQQKAYDLAVRYYQASYLGDCWFLTRYSHSISDSVRENEANYVSLAVNYLSSSKLSSVFDLREKSLYALAFIPDEPWGGYFDEYEKKYNTEKINTASRQYHSLIELALFARKNQVSRYVSKCDVLNKFISMGKE